jgi:hypothetical protein
MSAQLPCGDHGTHAARPPIIIGIIALVVAIKKFFGKGKTVTES